ncbi:MAG TPA: hypothetical protein VNO81_11780, partial [Candidatus Nitrosotenuis sp.]|nr:hypothetical protein [Candidatus Nitrosotenuis sp.]
AFHRPGWRPPRGWRPALFPGTRLWVEHGTGRGRLEFPQPGLEPLDLEPAEATLATRLESPRRPSARALAALGRRGALAPPPP